jgi:enoyl-CoA hydratase
MNYEHLSLGRTDSIAVVTLSSGKANAMSAGLVQELGTALRESREDPEVTALILTGGESRFLSFGLDVRYLLDLDRQDMGSFLKHLNTLLRGLYTFPKPTVGAINGHAVAGGLLMAIATDYRIGGEGEFTIGLSEVNLGIAAPASAIRMLSRRVGHRTATELCLTGAVFRPTEALTMGLYNELVPITNLMGRAIAKATEMAEHAPEGLALNKRFLSSEVFDIDEDRAYQEDEAWLNAWFHPATRARLQDLSEKK